MRIPYNYLILYQDKKILQIRITFKLLRKRQGMDALRIIWEHRTVRLVSHNRRHPAASPGLLRLHAAVANVFHASGMAEPFDSYMYFRKRGQIGYLTTNGLTDISAYWVYTLLIFLRLLVLLIVAMFPPINFSPVPPSRG